METLWSSTKPCMCDLLLLLLLAIVRQVIAAARNGVVLGIPRTTSEAEIRVLAILFHSLTFALH
jgi:hypothetical protein